MISPVAQRILDETPEEIHRWVDKHTNMVVRMHQLLEKSGMTQKQLAEKMHKRPSEISRWFSGRHNMTFDTLLKLEAALGGPIVEIVR